MRAEIVVEASGSALVYAVGFRPLYVGRADDCDVIVQHETTSRRHLVVWVREGEVWAEDLKSRNGTLRNGVPMAGPQSLRHGDELRLGPDGVRVRVIVDERGLGQGLARRLALESVVGRVRYPLGPDPLHVGSGPRADIRVRGAADVEAVLMAQNQGQEVWIGRGDEMLEVPVGAIFSIGGAEFRVVEVETTAGTTVGAEGSPWPYRLDAVMEASGPRAVVLDISNGTAHTLVGTNGATLLYLLSRQWSLDHERGMDPDEVGWCDDERLIAGIWGRASAGAQLKVAVCRLRSELRLVGFDPWFLEKRRGAMRARVRLAVAV